MTSPFQNITREELVLRRIFDDPVIQNKVLSSLEYELFQDTTNQHICKAILECYNEFGKFPQAQDLVVALPDNSAERSKLIKIMNYKTDNIDTKMAINIIETFFKEKKTENILVDAAESIHDKDFKNISALIKELEEAVNFSLYMDIGLDLVEDTTKALKLLNETHGAIPSSLTDIRSFTSGDNTGGGFYRSALSVFQGMPNVGKTILLCNEAAFAYQAGFNVLYITLELASHHIWERIACNVTGIPIYKIRKEKSEDIEQLLKEHKELDAPECGNLVVRRLPSTTTPLDLKNLINEIKIAKGFGVDLLVVDYLQKMKPNKKSTFSKNASLYTLGMEVSEQLRDLGESCTPEIAVLTASQVNREGYDNAKSGMGNTAGSAGINDTCDLMITITQEPYLQKHNMFLHTIIKNRFGPKMNAFLSECKYELMQVRSASADQINMYRESMINQDVNVNNFTDVKNTQNTAMLGDDKDKKEEKQKQERERIRSIQTSIEKSQKPVEKQHILVNNEVEDKQLKKEKQEIDKEIDKEIKKEIEKEPLQPVTETSWQRRSRLRSKGIFDDV